MAVTDLRRLIDSRITELLEQDEGWLKSGPRDPQLQQLLDDHPVEFMEKIGEILKDLRLVVAAWDYDRRWREENLESLEASAKANEQTINEQEKVLSRLKAEVHQLETKFAQFQNCPRDNMACLRDEMRRQEIRAANIGCPPWEKRQARCQGCER